MPKLIDAVQLAIAIEAKRQSFLGTMSADYRNGYMRCLENVAEIINAQPTYIKRPETTGLTNKQVIKQMGTRELADFLNSPICDKCERQSRCGGKDMRNCTTGITRWLNLTYDAR
jgi:hypothetical protein